MTSVSAVIVLAALSWMSIKYGKCLLELIRHRWRISSLPTLPDRAYPLIGHMYLFPADQCRFIHAMKDMYLRAIATSGSKMAVTWFGPMPVCSLIHPDAAEVLFRSHTHIEKPAFYKQFLPWLGDGLALSKGDKWLQRRRLITPTFHFNILDHFVQVMSEQARVLVHNIHAQLRRGEQVDVVGCLGLCTLDIICETAMGIQVNAQQNKDHYYVKAIKRVAELNLERAKNPLLSCDLLFALTRTASENRQLLATLHRFTADVIRRKLAETESASSDETSSKRMAFLDVLTSAETADGRRLSAADIQEEVDTFMFGGHDTNAASLAWTLYLLARHPDVQAELQREVDRFFAHGDDPPTLADVSTRLLYLEQVVKESLRLFPPAPMVGRVLAADCVIDGCTVPRGTVCHINIFMIHRNPVVWRNPDRFDPDRHCRARAAGRHPYAFVPFSAGPRNCVGQKFAMLEQKVVLAQFVHEFAVSTDVRERDLRICTGLVTCPKNAELNVTRRRRRDPSQTDHS